jgi:peptidoglycan biosynthesis protein MviN/MurJ (putative lipid II flippase)
MAANVILSKYLRAAGIALATSITVMLGTLIYAQLLHRYFCTENRVTKAHPLWTEMLKTVLATVPVGLTAWPGLEWIGSATASSPCSSARWPSAPPPLLPMR